MPDLANVNISIQQFQAVATGKYNAGEVRLANETTLEKINNSVHFKGSNQTHFKGSNQTTLSHLEVLAIKNAFIKALSQNGVGVDEIARIRRDLGLAADTSAGADKKLSERSIKPLSRAQIRTILDRNAETINANAGAGTIRTDAELHAGYSEARRASLAATREATNAGLAATRELDESHNIAIFQDLIAGNIYFREMEDTVQIIEYAKLQRDTILAKSGGHLRTEGRGVLQYQTRSNQSIDFELPTDEASYVRYLDETIVHLSSLSMQGANADSECGRVRREFASAPSKNSWIETHARSGKSWKIRTAAVMLLEEAGIHDWATLSCVNRITDAEVKACCSAGARAEWRRRRECSKHERHVHSRHVAQRMEHGGVGRHSHRKQFRASARIQADCRSGSGAPPRTFRRGCDSGRHRQRGYFQTGGHKQHHCQG